MNHLYESPDRTIHLCNGERIVENDPATYVVWTKCGKDVPPNQSFKSAEEATCQKCLVVKNLPR